MRVRIIGGVGDMSRDFATRPVELARGTNRVAREAARDGQRTAQRIARRRYGRGHAREYAGHIGLERTGTSEWEYGPNPVGQGLLGSILERGSRNNSAHHNLDNSADLMAPGFHRSVGSLLDGLFSRGR